MAATVSLSISLDPQHHCHHHRRRHRHHFSAAHQTLPFTLFPKYPLSIPHKSDRSSFNFKSVTTTCTTTTAGTTETTPTETSTSSFLEYPLRTGRFLSNSELEQLKFLENFRYDHEFESGSMWVRVMRPEELDMVVGLLAESFAESMLIPTGYVSLLGYLVKQYLFEKMELLPHTATLIGFYRTRKQEGREEQLEEETEEEEEEEEEVDEVEFLAGTVEVCFDKVGANINPPTPTPPKDSPYISNMAVKKSLRRRGIGWHLLKASEELISQLSPAREVYLHCRMIDAAPFSMYQKAGYDIVKTDSILVLLLLQRRKHLMRKNLPVLTSFMESDTVFSEEEITS